MRISDGVQTCALPIYTARISFFFVIIFLPVVPFVRSNGVRDVASRIRGSCIPCSMHQITGNGVAAIMIPVDCPREPGPLSLTHKRFTSGQFFLGTTQDVFLMAPITAAASGRLPVSPARKTV